MASLAPSGPQISFATTVPAVAPIAYPKVTGATAVTTAPAAAALVETAAPTSTLWTPQY